MTQEEKELLVKDLSGRLPYKVKVCLYKKETCILMGIDGDKVYLNVDSDSFYIENIKPYLRPLSSMTEEQKEEYVDLQQRVIYNSKGLINSDVMEYVNWCYKNHIDINNLIPMGLANDATDKNIY